MPVSDTERIYQENSNLTDTDKMIILSKILSEISCVYDIKGVGKEIRKGIDAQEYVNNERASWE